MEIEKYYEILGVNDSSSIGEIRRAYRQQAKAWHPDVNKSPGAHEKFILLREAYEYLTDLKSGRLTKSPEVVYTWTDERTEEARARAEKYAGMNYREFKKSDYSRGSDALETVADHINLIFTFFLSVVIVIVLTSTMGVIGFVIGIALSCLILYFSYNGVSGGVNFQKFLKSFWFIISHRMFLSVLLFAFNFAILLIVGFQTLISLKILFAIYFIGIVLMWIFVYFIRKARTGFDLRFYPICVAPLMVNIFLIINFVFSSNPREETYSFLMSSQSTTINLEGAKYSEYEGIRMFMDLHDIFHKNLITYTFEDGLFGLRVMKSYKISETIFNMDGESENLP